MTVELLEFSELDQLWDQYGRLWKWRTPFVTPPWLRAWWRVFSGSNELMLTLVVDSGMPIGLAPLMSDGNTARIIGSPDLCDSGDVIVALKEEKRFFSGLFNFLESKQISRLVLEPVRPDSIAFQAASHATQGIRWRSTIVPLSSSVEMRLPESWQEYLDMLSSKQRHEVRRKLRRLDETGVIVLSDYGSTGVIDSAMDQFIDLFRLSRKDKAAFMNEARERFFRGLASELAAAGMLRLQGMTIGEEPAAMVFCIEHVNHLFLYNNSYNPRFRGASVGLMSKVLSIQAAIEANLEIYDFLGGTERYKYQLGGMEITLYSCVFECLS